MRVLLQIFIVCCFSCCIGQVSKKDGIGLPGYATFYWIDNSEMEFYTLNFDSVSCNLFSFGERQSNSVQKLKVLSDGLTYKLEDPSTKRYQGEVTILNDSTVVLMSPKGISFRMISHPKFEKLFSVLQSKYSYKCIQRDEISFNGIVPERTLVQPFLNDSKYKQETKRFEDEIYGTEVHTYLELNGNRFYYYPKGGQAVFSKIEIVSDDLDSAFLDIRVGDTFEEVVNKLKVEIPLFTTGKLEVRVRICNSRYIGSFGYLLFTFHQAGPNSLRLLEKITCQPFEES